MNKEERSQLVEAWINLQRADPARLDLDSNLWAHGKLWDLARFEPGICLQIVLEIADTEPSDHILASLAAGPLEDMLSMHGESIIEEIERLAVSHATFPAILRNVWKNNIPDPIWRRVQMAAGNAG
jgi:hypothetical protein